MSLSPFFTSFSFTKYPFRRKSSNDCTMLFSFDQSNQFVFPQFPKFSFYAVLLISSSSFQRMCYVYKRNIHGLWVVQKKQTVLFFSFCERDKWFDCLGVWVWIWLLFSLRIHANFKYNGKKSVDGLKNNISSRTTFTIQLNTCTFFTHNRKNVVK